MNSQKRISKESIGIGNKMDYKKEYERWRFCATDNDIKAELEKMDETAIEDAF